MNLRNGKQYINDRREIWYPIWLSQLGNYPHYVEAKCDEWILETWY